MFTGLIETIGHIHTLHPTAAGRRLTIDLGPLAGDAHLGDSIAVNGVCLTISDLHGSLASFDVMAETLRVSTLQHAQPADPVNLERALPAQGRFGGHLVQGHIDGLGTIKKIDPKPHAYTLWITADPDLMKFMIPKGAVALDGVSLTIVQVNSDNFSVSLIPTTLRQTTLQHRKIGDKLNLEADLLSKWIRKRLDEILPHNPSSSSITLEKLRNQGFA